MKLLTLKYDCPKSMPKYNDSIMDWCLNESKTFKGHTAEVSTMFSLGGINE